MAQKEHISIVLTTHVPDHAILLGSKVGILDRSGHLISGNAEDIVTETNLQRIYQTDLRMVYVPEVERMACLAGNIH
jgi:iron complex transport system ATP-binding protein